RLTVPRCKSSASSELYTLSLHDALPICTGRKPILVRLGTKVPMVIANCTMEEYSTAQPIFFIGEHPESQLFETGHQKAPSVDGRSEEHTSELQSRENLVCRLLLEKKNRR